jgi:hypothetical protein
VSEIEQRSVRGRGLARWPQEEWRFVVGSVRYEVSSLGRVRSLFARGSRRRPEPLVLTPSVSAGYLSVSLADGLGNRPSRRVHCLVLEAFLGPCPPGMEACHDPDPTRSNCRLDNLRWDTPANNQADCRRHGRKPPGAVSRAKLSAGQALVVAMLLSLPDEDRPEGREIAASFRIHPSTVADIKSGKRWGRVTGVRRETGVHV